MTEPDLPITPPIREALQRRRKATWPGGTDSGGGGLDCLERFEGPFGGNGYGSGAERLAGGERKLLPIISSLSLSLSVGIRNCVKLPKRKSKRNSVIEF